MENKILISILQLITLVTIYAPFQLRADNINFGQPTKAPEVIWVADFTVDVTNIQMHPGPLEKIQNRPLLERFHILQRRIPLIERYRDPKELSTSIVNILANSITRSLTKASLPALRLTAGASKPDNGWLVSGRFDRVEEGHIAEEAIIGFGHGDPKVEISGTVAKSGFLNDPFLVFGESSKKHKMPGGAVGAIITHTPYMIAAKFVLNSHATERDVKEMGRVIVKEIVHYMVQKKLISN